jgi:hypothetical protein
MLFEVALVRQPTKKEQEDGKLEELIMAPTCVVARDDKSASVQAVMANKDKISGDISNVTVLVRPLIEAGKGFVPPLRADDGWHKTVTSASPAVTYSAMSLIGHNP